MRTLQVGDIVKFQMGMFGHEFRLARVAGLSEDSSLVNIIAPKWSTVTHRWKLTLASDGEAMLFKLENS